MKRETENLNLRDAFRPMPEQCRGALMTAARSVKEEEPVKRITFRAVLIAACIILATTAIAVAAGKIFGWNDFFDIFYGDTRVPTAAQEILAATEEKSFELGPMTFKVEQVFSDRHTALASLRVSMTDGSRALMTMSGQAGDPICGNGENGEKFAESLGVDPFTTWTEAAKKLNCPLFIVRGLLDLEPQYWGGEEMEDVLYDPDGSLVYYSMQMLDSGTVGEEIPMRFYLSVAEVDPETGEEKEALTDQPELTVKVAQAMDTVTWTLPEPYTVNGLTMNEVRGELTPAGLYLFTDFTADENAEQDDIRCPVWQDAEGKEYSFGLNLSYDLSYDDWPKVSMMGLISVDSIPEKLTMSMKDQDGVHVLSLPDGHITVEPAEE